MVIETTDFDISAIAESGQCFRITKAHDSDKKTYDVIYRDKYVRVSEEGYDEGTGLYKISFDCEKNEYENVWRHYLTWILIMLALSVWQIKMICF